MGSRELPDLGKKQHKGRRMREEEKSSPWSPRLGEDICVFKWNTVNLTPLGGFQYTIYQTMLHLHKAATWKNVYFETEARTYEHCWFIQELTSIQPPPATNLSPGGSSTEVSQIILATQLEHSQIKLWNLVPALLRSQFSKDLESELQILPLN